MQSSQRVWHPLPLVPWTLCWGGSQAPRIGFSSPEPKGLKHPPSDRQHQAASRTTWWLRLAPSDQWLLAEVASPTAQPSLHPDTQIHGHPHPPRTHTHALAGTVSPCTPHSSSSRPGRARRRKLGRSGSAGEQAGPWGASRKGWPGRQAPSTSRPAACHLQTPLSPRPGACKFRKSGLRPEALRRVTPRRRLAARGSRPPFPPLPAARGVLALLHDPRENSSAPGGCQASTGHT